MSRRPRARPRASTRIHNGSTSAMLTVLRQMMAQATVSCLLSTLLVAPARCHAGTVLTTSIHVPTDVAVHVVDARFLSFTLDAIELTNGFNGSSLTSTVLLKCTQALTPAYLRIGGSTEDFLRYSFAPQQQQRYHRAAARSGQQLPPPNITFAMNASAWALINAFAVTAGVDVLFGLNGLTCRSPDTSSPWDPRVCGAGAFLNFTLSQPYSQYPVAGFELSNENDIKIRGGNTTVPPAQLAADFRDLRRLVDALAAAHGRPRPLLFGPDTATLGGIGNPTRVFQHYFSEFAANLSAGVLDELTFHQYYFRGPGAHASQFMSAATFDSLRGQITTATTVFKKAASAGALPAGNGSGGVCLGETASSFSGGTPGISDSFASTFSWVDKLGLSASMGLSRVFRQDLAGGESYSLFTLKGGKELPTPDYWAALLWRRLMGSKVLSANYTDQVNGARTLRAYAHCTASAAAATRGLVATGDVTLALINLNNATASFNISTSQQLVGKASIASATLYTLVSVDGGYTGYNVNLNGRLLAPLPDGTPPDVVSMGQTLDRRHATAIEVPGFSVSFATLHGVSASACL